MPSGTMAVFRDPSRKCLGDSGILRIEYAMKGGIQKGYHENPGVAYSATHRVAYLPNNEQSLCLLKRLKFAFQCGLTFGVGSSLTSGQTNVIHWGSIHHKTSLSGGAHGFPDENYFRNCNEDLDALGVPKAGDLFLTSEDTWSTSTELL